MYETGENGVVDEMVKRSSEQDEALLVHALYPYSYNEGGQQISFEAGDSFILVEKSTTEWWRVYKDGRKFYVPANYVCESTHIVDEENLSTGSLNSQGEINTLSPSSESSLHDYDENTDKEVSEESTSFGGSDSEGIYANLPVNVAGEGFLRHNSTGHGNKPIYFTRPKSATLPSGWVVETDNSSGRPLYVNTKTNESMLKPPRGKPVYNEDDTQRKFLSLPRGWRLERQASEEYLYVNESNNELWQSSKDESGRVYYYNVNGGNSCWELPLFEVTLKVPDATHKLTRHRVASEGSEPSVVHFRHKSPQLHLRSSKSASMIAGIGLTQGNASAEMSSFTKGHQRSSSDQMRNSLTMTDDFAAPPFLPQLNYTITKEGTVNRRKLCDKGGKKSKKVSWSPCYLRLSSSNMIIYKNQNSASKTGGPHGRPESSCDLRGAVIEKMPDESKKRNIFQVASVSKLCFLIQVDDVQEFQDWYHMIFDVVKCLNESDPLEHGMKAKLYGDVIVSKPPMQVLSGFSSRSSLKKIRDGDKKNIRDKLKKLMSRRPTMEELHKKGIMKDITFGCHMAKLCEREQSKIPRVVIDCIEAIEAKGLDFDGLYRISGNVSSIQQLRINVDQEENLKFGERPFDDVHVLTGTLKLYFRELPEPLFPFDSYDAFTSIIKKNSKQEKTTNLLCEINKLPSPNLETFRYLFSHLRRVMENSKKNRMHAHNLAIVFGPTLLAPREEHGNLALNMVYQNQVIEYILLEYDNVL